MASKSIPASLKRWAKLIDEIEDYRNQGPGGDGYWVHLVPGYIQADQGVHSVHEDNITQCADVFKSGLVKPCVCDECKGMIAKRVADSQLAV